jgi:hypothetical protein
MDPAAQEGLVHKGVGEASEGGTQPVGTSHSHQGGLPPAQM